MDTTFRNTSAYDAGRPCLNPNCRSHGRPHPSCRCYGAMASGGDVSHYCAEPRKHDAGCEYYADGGDVSSIPDGFTLDPPPSDDASADPASVPAGFTLDPPPADDAAVPAGFKLDPPPEDDDNEYGGVGQGIAAGLEGVGKGIAGPVVPAIEYGLSKLGVPGTSLEAQAGRNKEWPGLERGTEAASMVASTFLAPELKVFTLSGNVAKIAEAAKFGKWGAVAVKNAITGGMIQGSDEVTKSMLGQGGSAGEVIGSIAAASALSMATGVLFNKSASYLQSKANDQAGAKAMQWLRGVGVASKHAGDPAALEQAQEFFAGNKYGSSYKDGTDFITKDVPRYIQGLSTTIATSPGAAAGAAIGNSIHGAGGMAAGTLLGGAASAKLLGPMISKIIGRPVNSTVKRFVGPAVLHILGDAEEPTIARSIADAVDHSTRVGQGLQKINSWVENLFRVGGQQTLDTASSIVEDKEKLDKYIGGGGITPEITQGNSPVSPATPPPEIGYAEGGEVAPRKTLSSAMQPKSVMDGTEFLTRHYPDQAAAYGAARGRVSNYLTSLRPQKNTPKLAFDPEPNQKDKQRKYDKALGVAVSPLSVIEHIKKGTLDPEHVAHLNQLYPELASQLKNKITEHITQAQMDGTKPSHKVRSGLSMFMGTELDSTMTPTSIQAAQHVFQAKEAAQQQAQQMAAKTAKKGTAGLGKMGQNNMTPEQAKESHAQAKD